MSTWPGRRAKPKTVLANNVIDGTNVVARAMRNSLLESEKDKVKKEFDRITSGRDAVTKGMAELDKKITSPEGRAVLEKVVAARATYGKHQEEFLKLMGEGKADEAKVLMLSKIRAATR